MGAGHARGGSRHDAAADRPDRAQDETPGEGRSPLRPTRPAPTQRRSLVLNASMEPLSIVAARRAVVLVLDAKADVVHADGARCRSSRIEVPVPSVVRLRRYVAVPRRGHVTLSRRGVFARDGGRCQYCGSTAENVDHVIPRSRGGQHAWDNVVASCRRCNSRKKDRTPQEAGMRLARAPVAPRPAFWLVAAVGRLEPEWARYVGRATTDALLPDETPEAAQPAV